MRERFPVLPDAARRGEGGVGETSGNNGEGRGLLARWLQRRFDAGPQPEGPPDTGETMERTIADLSRRQEDMAFLGGVAQLFQACRTVAEVCDVARDRLESLLQRWQLGNHQAREETHDSQKGAQESQ